MDVLKLMKDRYSCRKFSDKLLTKDQVNNILEAGRVAPSAKNKQPWRFLVIETTEGLNKVGKTSPCRFDAPVAILVSFDKTASEKNPKVNPDYGWIDCGIAISQMALEAEAQGLGSCIVGMYEPDAVRTEFNLPEDFVPYLYLMVGYTDKPASHLHTDRLPLSDLVTYESY